MFRWMFFFLLFSLLHANPYKTAITESDPSAFVEGKINVITGDYYSVEEDFVINGAEPIRINRSLISSERGDWSIIPHATAHACEDEKDQWIVTEKNGGPIRYQKKERLKINGQRHYRYEPILQGLSNTSSGEISALTNIKNNYILFDEKYKFLTLYSADGSERKYQKNHHGEGKYRLLSERLANGNWVLYEYESAGDAVNLKSIVTKNPSQTKVYARADFNYEDPKRKNKRFFINTSSGDTLEYCFLYRNRDGRQSGPLEKVQSPILPELKIGTLKYRDKKDVWEFGDNERVIESVSLAGRWTFGLEYYLRKFDKAMDQTIDMQDTVYEVPKHNRDGQTEKKVIPDPRRGRVKAILQPTLGNGERNVTHTFIYEIGSKKTSVYDSDRNKTDYFYNDEYRLEKIDRYTKEGNLQNSEKFVWGKGAEAGQLICKTFFDRSKPIFSKRYFYDGRGNVKEEKLYGNLSGKSKPLSLGGDGLPNENGVESVSRYTFYERDLPVEQREPNGCRGCIIRYSYVPNTNLIKTKSIGDRNGFYIHHTYTYDDDLILIKETIDDGQSILIKSISPRKNNPHIGLPDTIEEKYWDGSSEVLLRKTVLHYNRSGEIERKDIYDANGSFQYSLETEYDEKKRIIRETNPIGQTALTKYDTFNNRSYHKDFSGRLETTFRYDSMDRLIEKEELGFDQIRRTFQYGYDKKSNLISTIDPNKNETRYVPDCFGQIKETHLPPVSSETGSLIYPVIKQFYDQAGNVTEVIDSEGHTTKTEYNIYGKPILISYPNGEKEEFIYYLDGTLKHHINSNGVSDNYSYDHLNRVEVKSITRDQTLLAFEQFEYAGNRLAVKTDMEGNKTVYTYDRAGRKSIETFANETTSFAYDSLGRLSWVKKGDTCKALEYDLLDRIITEKVELTSGELRRSTSYEYDTAGNQVAIIRNIGGFEAREEFSYDSQNRLIFTKNALGITETISYNDQFRNDHNQLVLQKIHTDGEGLQTIETFNTQGQIAKLEKRKEKTVFTSEKFYNYSGKLTLQKDTIYAPNETSKCIHTRWKYDNRGRLISLIEADGTTDAKTTTYAYTSTGGIAKITKPSGVEIKYGYNDFDLLTCITSSDHTVRHEMGYNKLGSLVKVDNISRKVDPRGRTIEESVPSCWTVQTTYDVQGRKEKLEIPLADCTIKYDYRGEDLQKITRETAAGSILYAHEFSSYDLAGNVIQEKLIGNLGTRSYQIDPLSRRTSISTPQFFQQITEFDKVGNIQKMQLQQNEIQYSYDSLYQLASESGPLTHSYQYDTNYNRLQKDQESYQINALNQDLTHFVYDKNGNPIQQGAILYRYDALDRLIKIEAPDYIQTFRYDSLHRCLSKTTHKNGASETRTYLYDGQNEIGSFDENKQLIDLRILGATPHAEIGSAVAIELNQAIFAPIHDLQGNVAALLPITQEAPTFYTYTAFGEETIDGPALSPWRFSSKRVDLDSGLVNYGRRYYVPSHGRWLTPDPLGFTAGMNLYAFVQNNPLIHLDEYGLFILSISDKALPELPESTERLEVAAIHEFGSQALDVGRFIASTPYQVERGFNYLSGRKSSIFSGWNETQNQIFNRAEDWIYKALPTDRTHPDYLTYRKNIRFGTAIGSLAAGGYGAVKGIVGFSRLAKMPAQTTKIVNFSTKQIRNNNGFFGTKGFELKNFKYQKIRNNPATIQRRSYGGHALDQMQNRGLTPSVVEEAIQHGIGAPNKIAGRMQFYDPINNISVITENKKVITVMHGRIR